MGNYKFVTRRRILLFDNASNFTPLDLVGTLGINHLASKYATLDDSFRLAIYKDANGDVPAWSDLRFLGGTFAVLYMHFNSGDNFPIVERLLNDSAIGLLSSFVATETCRAAAVKRMTTNKVTGEEISGSYNVYSDEYSEEEWANDPNLEDIYGIEEELEEEQVSYAYGW